MNTCKLILLLIFNCCFLFAVAQEGVQKFVQENTVEIKTNNPESTDYSDLEIIGKAIGNAKVVMLGEQDHGDAPTFLAKTRLIKYLHEKKGFNVLAFEADFFGINYEWELVKSGKLKIDALIKRNITPLWTNCREMQYLFDVYLPAMLVTKNPLQLTGFDSQMNTQSQIFTVLDSIWRALQIPVVNLPEYATEIYPLLRKWYSFTKDTATTDKIIHYYRQIKTEMSQRLPADDFWVMAVDNLIQLTIQFRNYKKDYWKDMNTRDIQMAANLKWLSKVKYANEKIIVWAHNYHVSKYSGHYSQDFMNKAITMGSVFTEDFSLSKTSYVIGFTSYEGNSGRVFSKPYQVEKPKSNSFENWISKDYNFAFVDFTKFNSTTPSGIGKFSMKGSLTRQHSSQDAQWNRIFDGIFYIKEMYACHVK